jgi:hypothetical protein
MELFKDLMGILFSRFCFKRLSSVLFASVVTSFIAMMLNNYISLYLMYVYI